MLQKTFCFLNQQQFKNGKKAEQDSKPWFTTVNSKAIAMVVVMIMTMMLTS
jgi:hypothetical protein